MSDPQPPPQAEAPQTQPSPLELLEDIASAAVTMGIQHAHCEAQPPSDEFVEAALDLLNLVGVWMQQLPDQVFANLTEEKPNVE